MRRLDGRVIAVTGAAGGIGAAVCERLAREGAALAIVDIEGAPLPELAQRLESEGVDVLAFAGDIGAEDNVVALMAEVRERFGRLDGIDNNAAATGIVVREGPIADLDVSVWDEAFRVNVRAAFLVCKYGIPLMLEGGGGSIVNMSSGLSFAGDRGRAAYGTSKAAVNAFTKYVATHYGKQGIRCNAIAPGLILSDRAKSVSNDGALKTFLDSTLLPRLGYTADIADAVAFLLSDESAFITGQVLAVDGGHSAHQPHWAQQAPADEIAAGTGRA